MNQETFSIKTLFTTEKGTLKFYPFNTPLCSHGESTYFVWRDNERRPRVTKVSGSGSVSTVYLEGPDYKGSTDTHNTWTMGIDKEGYIHIVGDMHNGRPNSELPDRFHNHTTLYWRSKNPQSINKFDFLGNVNSRQIPTNEDSYYSFYNDRRGELFYLARSRIKGRHFGGKVGITLCKYNTQNRRWTMLGDYPPVTNRDELIKFIVWEDDGFANKDRHGSWYQHGMTNLVFDLENNLHIGINWNNDGRKIMSTHLIYAKSRDGGNTWEKANGEIIKKLPLRVEEGPNQADIVSAGFGKFPLSQMGAFVTVDGRGVPSITCAPYDPNNPRHPTCKIEWDNNKQKWGELIPLNVYYWIRPYGIMNSKTGILNYTMSGRLRGIWRIPADPTISPKRHDLGFVLTNLDTKYIMNYPNLKGLEFNENTNQYVIHQIDFQNTPPPDLNQPIETISNKMFDGYFTLVHSNTRKSVVLKDTFNVMIYDKDYNIIYRPNQKVDQVVFFRNNKFVRTEKNSPYCLSGDNNGVLQPLEKILVNIIRVQGYINSKLVLTDTIGLIFSED